MLALLPLASCSEEANPNEGDDLKAFIQDQENKYEITFKEGDTLSSIISYEVEGKNIINFYTDDEFLSKADMSISLKEGETYFALTESTSDIIEISTVQDFKNITEDGNYRLTNDIDFNGEIIDLNFDYLNPFKGYFNGNGYTLKNFNLPDKEYSALFGVVEGTIFNVKVDTEINANFNNVTYISPLVGYLKSGGLIRECSAYGNVSINTTKERGGVYLGGINARNDQGRILLSENFSSLSNYTNVNAFTGGIVAYNGGGEPFESKLSYSYSSSKYITSSTSGLNTSSYSGGIAGFNFGEISHTYSNDKVIRSRSNDYQAFGASLVADNNGGKVSNSFGLGDVIVTSDRGYVFSGNTVGRNFKSSLESDSGTVSNLFGYDKQNIKSFNGSRNALKENLYFTSLKYEEISSSEFLEKLSFCSVFNVKSGYLPSINCSFEKIDSNVEYQEITNVEDFLAIKNDLTGKYILTNDITIDESDYSPIGNYQTPFKGILDGNGHTITYEVSPSSRNSQDGLFGFLNGVVKNLNIAVKGDIVNESNNVIFGGLSGYALKSSIENVSVDYENIIEGNGVVFGGLVGINEDSLIEKSSANGSISAKASEIESYLGGLVGRNSGEINFGSSDSTIEVTQGSIVYIGGLVGKNYKNIKSSYAISEIKSSNISDEKAIGGFTGANFDLGNIVDSYSMSNIENTREAIINLLGGFSGDNLQAITNCYYYANEEIKYSAGESLVFTDIERVSLEELKTLASSLNDNFVDGEYGYPVLNSEENI